MDADPTLPSRRPLYLEGGLCLIGEALVETGLLIEDGVIAAIGEAAPAGARRVDARGVRILPGLVDVHGDAFERQIMPRTNVHFPMPLALADTDRQLAANGITTAYHGLTLSWEPGLRSVAAGRTFMEALDAARPTLSVDNRVQLRWETYAFEAVDSVLEWIGGPGRPALAFNDHMAATMRRIKNNDMTKIRDWSARAGLSQDEYLNQAHQVAARADAVDGTIRKVAAAARAAECVMLSHDDYTVDDRILYRGLGASVAEFPMVLDAAKNAVENGEHSVLGAPNVVRDGSHTGALHAADCIEDGLCTVLASDYYYPAMLAAVNRLVAERGLDLAAVWKLVSTNPAEAMCLTDRGELAVGKRADIVLALGDAGALTLAATAVEGRVVWGSADLLERVH